MAGYLRPPHLPFLKSKEQKHGDQSVPEEEQSGSLQMGRGLGWNRRVLQGVFFHLNFTAESGGSNSVE